MANSRPLRAAEPTVCVELSRRAALKLLATAPGAARAVLRISIAGILLALWSASTGMRHLIGALNLAYDEEETRTFVRLRAISLLLTLGAAGFVAVSIAVIAIGPALLADQVDSEPVRVVLSLLRWPLLALAMVTGLSVVYRYGPDRDAPRLAWAGVGCVHEFRNIGSGFVRWLETQAPQPPGRHSYRFARDWKYLDDLLAAAHAAHDHHHHHDHPHGAHG